MSFCAYLTSVSRPSHKLFHDSFYDSLHSLGFVPCCNITSPGFAGPLFHPHHKHPVLFFLLFSFTPSVRSFSSVRSYCVTFGTCVIRKNNQHITLSIIKQNTSAVGTNVLFALACDRFSVAGLRIWCGSTVATSVGDAMAVGYGFGVPADD